MVSTLNSIYQNIGAFKFQPLPATEFTAHLGTTAGREELEIKRSTYCATNLMNYINHTPIYTELYRALPTKSFLSSIAIC